MPSTAPAINLAHLDRLSQPVVIAGTPMLLTKIYADPPSYAPVDAPGEGIACVDDVARAAVVYLQEHARTGDAHALTQARAALDFTLHMQQPDGRFANFVTDERGTINMTGPTSRPGLGWWAFRGMWALARGYREFAGVDPAYAATLLAGYRRTEGALVATLAVDHGRTIDVGGRAVPSWIQRVPGDQASIAAIALAEMQEARPNGATRAALEQVADGVRQLVQRPGARGVLGFVGQSAAGAGRWHSWGAHGAEALATAGRVLGRRDLVDAAAVDLEGVLAWQLAAGRVFDLEPLPQSSGQQAYGIGAAVRGSMAMYRATGDVRYAQMAGLHASWLAGNNMAGAPMYDPATGRAFDGIDAQPRGINRSSGAESTIEALLALQAIDGVPEAQRMATMRPVAGGTTWTSVPAGELRDAGSGAPLATSPIGSGAGFAALAPGATATATMHVGSDGDYRLLAAHLLDASAPGGRTTLDLRVDGAAAAALAPHPAGGASARPTLERADGAAIHLAAGDHVLTVTARGAAGATPAQLQGVVLDPVVARTELADRAGNHVHLAWDSVAGHLDIAGR